MGKMPDTSSAFEAFMRLQPRLVVKYDYRQTLIDVELVVNGTHYVLEAGQPLSEKKALLTKYQPRVTGMTEAMMAAAEPYACGLKKARP